MPSLPSTGEPGDDDFGIAYNGWDDGISPWNFDVESEFWGSEYQGYLYTDRPIYRPGQTVYFKGISAPTTTPATACPRRSSSVQVQVSDPQGKELYKEKLPLNDMGTLYDELPLDEAGAAGHLLYRDPGSPNRISTSAPASGWPSTKSRSSRSR